MRAWAWACGLEGLNHTVRRPREIEPTNFNVDTVLEAMMAEGRIRSNTSLKELEN